MTHSYRSIWMNGFLKLSGVVLIFSALAFPADGMIESTWSKTDAALDTNPDSQFWRGAPPAYMEKDSHDKPVPRYRTEVRTRWTNKNLYFLFVCPYEEQKIKILVGPAGAHFGAISGNGLVVRIFFHVRGRCAAPELGVWVRIESGVRFRPCALDHSVCRKSQS